MPFHLKTRQRKRLLSCAALSLTELLVGSVLIGIVMVGALSVDYATQRLQSTSGDFRTLAMRTSAVMLQMTRDGMRAVGDDVNRGIVDMSSGGLYSLCFRQDTDGNPNSYTTDTWVCYMHGSSYNMWRCEGMPNPISNCNGSGYNEKIIYTIADFDPWDYFFDIVEDADGRINHVEIELKGRVDRSKPAHPITNPEYNLISHIKPVGHTS
jgi:hypothetical protein